MTQIEAIELDRLIIHGINQLTDEPEIADKEEIVSEGLRLFFQEHIRTCLKTVSAQMAKFNKADGTIASCTANIINRQEEFVEHSKVIGLWFAHQMAVTSQVQTFLAICLFTDLDTSEKYIALLKMDPVKAFVRSSDGSSIEQIQILPDPSRALGRYAVVRPYSDEDRYDVVYRNQAASREEDPETNKFWLESFLEAEAVPTPRSMTQLVVKETDKWIIKNEASFEDKEAQNLRNTVLTMAQSDELDVEAVAEQAIAEERMREEYISNLLNRGLTETSFQPDRNWAERTARKTTYVLDYNVQISGPSDSIDEVVQIMPKGGDRKVRLVVESNKFQQK
jgi:hypothetical protein